MERADRNAEIEQWMDPDVLSMWAAATFEVRRRVLTAARTDEEGEMAGRTIERELEVLSEEECLRLLGSRDLGRVAITVDRQPQVFPVNYAVDGGRVAFRTAPGTKLEHGPRTRVAFEVDEFDPSTGVGWSVMVQGTAYDITSTIDLASEALRHLAVDPLAPGEREHWLAVYPRRITGRRFVVASSAGRRSG